MISRCLHKAKDSSGNWVKGTPLETGETISMAIDGDIKNLVEVDKNTLCAYTGENTDIGDNKIFENDLIAYDHKKWKISYCKPIGGYQGTSVATRNGQEVTLFIPLSLVANGTIIGNANDERKDE